MRYVLLGALVGACFWAAAAVVARRAARGDHRWGVVRRSVGLPAAGAYRSSTVVRWRQLRAPRVAMAAAWSATVLAIVGVPAALVGALFAIVAASFDLATVPAAVLACAAPIALVRVLFGARTALGLLDADLGRVARARAEARWEKLFDASLACAMVVAVVVAGRVDAFAIAGVLWAVIGLGQALFVGLAVRGVAARLEHLRLPPDPDATPSPVAA